LELSVLVPTVLPPSDVTTADTSSLGNRFAR
jgi:hypothetical protein